MPVATPSMLTADQWERLARQETHPMKLAILRVMTDNPEPISALQLSRGLGADLTVVAYHVRVLRDRNWIVRHHTAQRRGALETFYVLAEDCRG